MRLFKQSFFHTYYVKMSRKMTMPWNKWSKLLIFTKIQANLITKSMKYCLSVTMAKGMFSNERVVKS